MSGVRDPSVSGAVTEMQLQRTTRAIGQVRRLLVAILSDTRGRLRLSFRLLAGLIVGSQAAYWLYFILLCYYGSRHPYRTFRYHLEQAPLATLLWWTEVIKSIRYLMFGPPGRSGFFTFRNFAFYGGDVFAFFVPLPLIFILTGRRWFAGREPGHCPTCGYDLRATPERCPECGRPADDMVTR